MVAASTRINALDSFGTKTPSKTDPIAAMRAANGMFGLRKVSLAEWSGQPANSDLHVVVRTDTNQAIGQVGAGYEPMTNHAFFGPVAQALVDNGAQIERFQTLSHGTRSFMRLSFPDRTIRIGRPSVGDVVGTRCTLATSHDGTMAGRFSLQMLRLVCSNGMVAPIAAYDMQLVHTRGGKQKLDDLQKMMPTIETYVRRFEIAANMMVQTPITANDPKALEIVSRIVDPQDKAGSTKVGTDNLAQQRVNRVLELFDGGQPGADEPECKDTAWGLYNAAVDYFTHEQRVRGQENQAEKRFRRLLPGGASSTSIVNAWDVVTSELGIQDAIAEAVAVN